ncbi:GldG family protein [Mahella australiensis]|uniref:ABC-type uncharacterized transport system n=1 Tax=Mahella australiensis (strain DSM 15567 / CIP 107919 / 50-1 BON) TaxID=697281 RepID=F4A3D1_MAHA5|nr:GldG family protein [Mahella australiensis]AEE97386.1 ABC-type uncharacterized transport system [Mahella australiensis 50-1 BON]
MKLNIAASFRNKKFRYGGYSALITVVVIAILIIVNLVVDQIPWKVDLTKNRYFSLSEQSYKTMDNIKKDVTIYGLYKTGQENLTVKEILNQYANYSDKIKIKFIDPVKNPTFAQKYSQDGTSLSEGSLIVDAGDKYKVIDQYALVNTSYNQYSGQMQADSLAVEQQVTGALIYVTSEKSSVLYALQGHNEEAVPSDLSKQLGNQNFELKELNLVTSDKVPDDAEAILVLSPKKDISAEEDKKLRDYLSKGGRAIFMMDLLNNELPNFQALFNSYGVELERAMVMDGDRSHNAGDPVLLVPSFGAHDIVSPLKSNKLTVIMPATQPIKEVSIKKRSLEIQPLLTTSSNSWAKVNLEFTSSEKEAGDLEGPFNVAVAITDKSSDVNVKDTKIILMGSSAIVNSQITTQFPANIDMVMNSINWLRDQTENISIAPKSLTPDYLNMTSLQVIILAAIVVIVIPLIILGMGLRVWLVRRHL